MRRILAATAIAASIGLLGAAAFAAVPSVKAVIVPGSDVKYKPGTGALKGTEVAVLAGDPTKKGSHYAIRLKLPDGTKFPPHAHAELEQVTVISGTLLLGLGDTMDMSKGTPLGPGSFLEMPPNVHHWAAAKGETIVELHGIGPETMVMLKKMPKTKGKM